MTRPTTRSKNKRNRQEDVVDLSKDILRKINESGKVTEDDIIQLYMVWKPVCQGCRVNTKDNPNCFCGLIPPPNGSRKTGLWQKMSDILQSFGPDPNQDLRASPDTPAGLTNLGATCYANSILQCLYMNRSFREGVFSVEPDVLKQNIVLYQLGRLFAQLHSSKKAFIDSAPFIKTLELDNGVQQDSHEFLTLLFSLLERCLRHSKVPRARTIVQDLFRGSVSHVTTCSKCGRDSEASSNMVDFYELELNVQGVKSLDESLREYLSLEYLEGENQYFCESCNMRVDATRSIKLRMLPDVLNIQLKRYVFHQQTTMRKKITSSFSFPGELNMGQRLFQTPESELIYDLSAVLVHKGTAANSGHYVAHIKDENTGQWWEFDDEHVSNLGLHPFGEGPSNKSTNCTQGKSLDSPSTHSVNAATNGTHLSTDLQQSTESCIGSNAEIFSSSEAYMLMYNRRCTNPVVEGRNMACVTSDMKPEADMVSLDELVSKFPHLFEEIKEMNASYIDACEKYKEKTEREKSRIKERRQEVRSILSVAPVQSEEKQYFWISSDWLRQWADTINPPAIDNNAIQCSHGKVPVSKIGVMKRSSAEAWAKLLSKYDGGPTLSGDDCCLDCLVDGARAYICADSYKNRRELMKGIATDVLAGKISDAQYYVSKSWLQQWVKRKSLDAPCEADAGPTVAIRCPHSYLMPEQAAGAKRVLVPENLWLFFYEDAAVLNPDDPSGYTAFACDSDQCPACSNELSEVACLEDSLRMAKLEQRRNHEKLAGGKNVPLSLNSEYYLLPSSWISSWRAYVNATGKNVSTSMKPESLDTVVNSLKCEKHMRLLERPPELIRKRGSIIQKASSTNGLTVITENDWRCFCGEWGCSEDKGVSAIIECTNSMRNHSTGASEEVPVRIEHVNPSGELNDEDEAVRPVIKTCPEVCEECIGERESYELMRKLDYSNEDIYVTLVRGKNPPSRVEPSKVSSEIRTSKRIKRSGNTINLKVSGSTPVYQLKMMLWESFGVVKENQILRKGADIIDNEMATLADMNVFPGDKLWLTDSEIHEHRDIADELYNQKGDMQQEEGFRGTLLHNGC